MYHPQVSFAGASLITSFFLARRGKAFLLPGQDLELAVTVDDGDGGDDHGDGGDDGKGDFDKKLSRDRTCLTVLSPQHRSTRRSPENQIVKKRIFLIDIQMLSFTFKFFSWFT